MRLQLSAIVHIVYFVHAKVIAIHPKYTNSHMLENTPHPHTCSHMYRLRVQSVVSLLYQEYNNNTADGTERLRTVRAADPRNFLLHVLNLE